MNVPAVRARVAVSTDDDVLDVVAGLVNELAGQVVPRPHLDDALDRDLGISSLERVELKLRLEQAFGISLPDSVMADAVTTRDLVIAVGLAAPATAAPPRPLVQPAAPATAAPAMARSLLDALRWHAERTPERAHIYLRGDDDAETTITYGELLGAAVAVAAGLRDTGVTRGDRVALMLRTERAFFEVFFGALLAGATPVPLYPPVRAEDLVAYTRRQQAILRNADARMLVTFTEAARLVGLMRGRVPGLDVVTTPARLAAGAGEQAAAEHPTADAPALIQYTSGSTGAPKGVLLSHANVLANVRALGDALEIGRDDVGVSWLPLYHDMGLIGMWLGALYFGVPVALMSPLAFLSRPVRWLWAIHAHRGTISAAPNFAFDLCARRIADGDIQGLDLSSWRVAVNGSEAVSPETIERFTRRFAACGFRTDAWCPAYGLAESSVALTLAPRRAPRVDRVARAPFERTREVTPAAADEPRALRFVSCGRPLRDHDVRIADRANRVQGDRVEGHIQFRGPSVMRGYFRNVAATAAVMHDGWMDSGDLGYLAGGELFITGRDKDVIVQGGRNICAEEVEALTASVPGIRPSCVVAFGVPDAATGTERLVVIAETRDRDPARRGALQRAVRDRLVDGIGSPPDQIVIADPRTVLKTSSGKLRRSAMRDAYLTGTIGAPRAAVLQRARLVADAVGARSRRVAGHVGRAIFTGWILSVLALSLPVLWAYLVVHGPGIGADRATKRWSRVALALCGLRPRVVGLDHLRNVDSGVLVANHASYIDPIVLMAAIPVEFHFVAKRALTAYPLVGTVIRNAGHVTIEKAALSDRLAGADEVVRRLREGERLVIFPEGTFIRAPGLLPFRLGAFRAAVDTGRPIVPVAIAGARHVLPDGAWLFRRGALTVTIGAPLYPRATEWAEMVRLRDAAAETVAHGCGEPAFTTSTSA